jgi:hypothetical protein
VNEINLAVELAKQVWESDDPKEMSRTGLRRIAGALIAICAEMERRNQEPDANRKERKA